MVAVRELVRTNNAVLITAIEALLNGAGIAHAVLDQHMSVMEGSLGMLPRRIVVGDEDHHSARQVLEDAGLGHELRPLPPGQAVGADRTSDAVLGGRLRLAQKARGHRFGHDAILLAASVPALTGDRALDFGAGVGAAGLALAARVPGVEVTLVEMDPELAALAAENIVGNRLQDRARALTLDVAAGAAAFAAAGIGQDGADHVLMNPPFNDPARQSVSPEPARRAAHSGAPSLLSDWVAAAAWCLHSAGTLTLIWRADGLAEVLSALDPGFGSVVLLPVHGRAGQPAIRVLVRASKGGRAPLTILPGLLLNDAAGRPTAEAEAVLRHAAALPLADA